MPDENVNPIHRQYMDLSARYKAGWTFHRFIQGLRKFFGSQDLEDHTADFQRLYAGLRDVSQSLNDPNVQVVIARLKEQAKRLDGLMRILEEEDRKVSPALVRMFFQRIKTHDDRILLDLIRFYLEVQRERTWEPERIDKADYLLTRLAESVSGGGPSSDRRRLSRVLEGVSALQTWSDSGDEHKVENRRKMIVAVRSEIERLDDFGELTERDLVGHYRHLKHGMGRLIFEKSVLPDIVETNLVLSRRIQELARDEERRIVQDYEKVSRLAREGAIDRELTASVDRLHLQVTHFRKQVNTGNLRLQDMTQIKQHVMEVLDRIEHSVPAASLERLSAGAGDVPGSLPIERALPMSRDRELLGEVWAELAELLGRTAAMDRTLRRAEAQSLSFRLEEREFDAFDRLSDDVECDEGLEYHVLIAAALRTRIDREVTNIHSRRSRVGEEEERRLEETEDLLDLCGRMLSTFAHYLENPRSAGQSADQHRLQRLRMRLMRDYSGLWLVAYSDSSE